jgi:two-component system, chemotaxis family, response regulator PixG
MFQMLKTSLVEKLTSLHQSEDGELVLCSQNIVWKAYIVKGKLFYIKDELHPVRRWDRSLKQYGSRWNWNPVLLRLVNQPFWECHLLDQGISREHLSLMQAKLVIRAVLHECLFELSGCEVVESDWYPRSQPLSKSCELLPLAPLEIKTVLNKATWLWQNWQSADLQQINPNLSPILKEQKTLQTMPIANSYLTGQFTLWDIAWQQGRSIVEIARDILPYIETGALQLRAIGDLPSCLTPQLVTVPDASPVKQTVTPNGTVYAQQLQSKIEKQPLIACIDDSPVLAHTLTKILQAADYRTISIQEPMRGFTQLIEQQPDLILLDLLLPNADGYSICKFLRDTPVFAKTPIIILTAQNTVIDRARALSIGATAFLGKPPQPQELLEIIQKHLSLSSTFT